MMLHTKREGVERKGKTSFSRTVQYVLSIPRVKIF